MAELTGRVYGEWAPPVEGSITSNRIGAAIDDYQANMWGLGEALTGSDWMKQRRLANEADAKFQHQNATKLGAVDSWADVNGVGDAANWLGGVAASSLPYVGETIGWAAADAATGGALTPAWLARAGAVAPRVLGGGALKAGADMATRRAALESGTGLARSVMGAGVATYPSAVGDILSNQRDETGETDLGMAALGGVPYAAANLLGVGPALANRSLTRNVVGALDNINGVKGGLARMGASMARTGLEEGTNETLQEMVNQGFGRMAVNPDQTLFNDEANDRYLESFAGGAALGGAFSTVGGWRRKNAILPQGQTVDQGATNLLGDTTPPTDTTSRALVPMGERGLARQYDTATPIDTNQFSFGTDQLQIGGPSLQTTTQEQTIPGVLNVTPNGTVAPMNLLSGQQYDMFGGPDTFGTPQAPMQEQAAPAIPDTNTPDMFQQTPSAMTRTMFNPMQEDSYQGGAAKNSRGAVAGTIRSLISMQLGGTADASLATALSLDLSKSVGDIAAMNSVLDMRQQAVQKTLDKLDKQVTGDSNVLTPEEYAKRREVLDNKLLTIEAARTLVNEYQRVNTNALAQEGQAKAQPGAVVGQAPGTASSEAIARENSLQTQLDEQLPAVDQAVADRRADDTKTARRLILNNVLGQKTRNNPVDRFQKALKAAGFADTNVTAEEQAQIDKITSRKADVRDATVVPPGLAAKNGQLVARADLMGESNADNGTTTAAATPATQSNTAVASVAAPADTQVNADTGNVVSGATAPAPAADVQQRNKANVKAAKTAKVTELIDAVDNAKDEAEYQASVDTLMHRWMEGSVKESDHISDWVEEQSKSFKAEWNAAEKRYTDNERGKIAKSEKVAEKAANPEPTAATELANTLNNWGRFRSAEEGSSKMSADAVSKAVEGAVRSVPNAPKVEVFANAQAAGLNPPAGVVPKGVTLPDGRILVFSDHATSVADVEETVFHEMFHRGTNAKSTSHKQYVETMLGVAAKDDFVQKLANDWKASADGQDKLNQYKEQGPMTGDRLAAYEALAVEEGLATIAEKVARGDLSNPRPTIKKIGAFLANLADKLGFKSLAQKLRRMSYTQTEKFVMDTISKSGGTFTPGNGTLLFRSAAEIEADEKASGTPKEFSSKWAKTPMGYLIRDLVSGWRANPWTLGFLTLDQIKDRFAKFENVGKAVDSWLRMGTKANELMRVSSNLHKRWASVVRSDKAMGRKLNSLFVDATLEGMWVNGNTDPVSDKRNAHIEWDDKTKATAEKLRAAYMSLSPEARRVYDEVTAELSNQFRAKQDAILQRVVDTYKDELKGVMSEKELLEFARSGKASQAEVVSALVNGVSGRERIELQRFAQAVDSTFVPQNKVPGPYFPLTRKGDHLVVVKSEGFQSKEADLEKARKALDELLSADIPTDETEAATLDKAIAEARKAVAAARLAVEDAKGNEAEYSVEFFNYMSEANDKAESYKGSKKGSKVTVMRRQEFVPHVDSLPAGFLNKLTDQLRKELPEGSRADVTSAVRQLVVQAMPERNAFKSELRRMNVAGVNPEDALVSFAAVSHRNAWTISRLENIAALSESMNQARASSDNDERAIGNELVKRWSKSMEYNPGNALIDAASNLSYVSHLGFSVGYYIQNMLQPWTVSLPVLAGKYGLGSSSRALGQATSDVVSALRKTIKQNNVNGNWEMPIDLDLFSGEERKLLEMLTNEGRIDITIRADLGAGGSTSQNAVGNMLKTAANWSSLPAHQVEVVNRVATALAAFRLAQQRGESVQASTAFADKVVTQTHVDYSVENAARFMNPSSLGGLGKLAFQFKRYQQAMVFLWGKTLYDAIKHGDRESAKTLMYLTGVNFATAGVSGLPIAAPMGLALSLVSGFGDDDQDRDLTEMFWAGVRGSIGDTGTDLLRKGVPAAMGIDMSNRIGAGDILSPVFRMPTGRNGNEVMGGWAMQLFGAAGGTAASWVDAATLMSDNPVKAIEKVLPAGFKGVMEAFDQANRGLTDRKGNVLLGADEFGTAEFLARLFNLGTATNVSNMYDVRNAILEAQSKRDEVRSRLMREYSRARMSGDQESLADTRAMIDAFNARNPREARITYSNLGSHYTQERKRQQDTVRGIKVDKRNKDIAADFGISK